MASWLTPVAACPRALTYSRHASLQRRDSSVLHPRSGGRGDLQQISAATEGGKTSQRVKVATRSPPRSPPAALCFKTTPTFSLNLEVHRPSSPVTNPRLPPEDKEEKSHGGQLGD